MLELAWRSLGVGNNAWWACDFRWGTLRSATNDEDEDEDGTGEQTRHYRGEGRELEDSLLLTLYLSFLCCARLRREYGQGSVPLSALRSS